MEVLPALDAWDREVLAIGGHVAALVLIVDRAHRAGFFGGPRHRIDGAAPIIGTSAAMQAVRERIDRVAPTDFNSLIEGAIDPQPHPNLIEVFGETPVDDRDGVVAGADQEGPVTQLGPALPVRGV